MSWKYVNREVFLPAGFLGCAALLGHGLADAPKSRVVGGDIMIADERGVVRLRIGRIGETSSYGLAIMDPDGKSVVSVSNDDIGSRVELGAGQGFPKIELSTRPDKASIAVGREDGWLLGMECSQGGFFDMSYRSASGSRLMTWECDPKGKRSGFGVADGSGGKVQLGVADGSGGMEVIASDSTFCKLHVDESEGRSVLVCGESGKGVTMGHSRTLGSVLLLRSGDHTAVGLQASKQGRLLSINADDGSPAVRVGLRADGELWLSSWSKKGEELPWFK